MKIYKNEQLDQRTHHFLMQSYLKPFYTYSKYGIIINFGPYKGSNLNVLADQYGDDILYYLEAVLDNPELPYKMRAVTKEVIIELNDYIKNNPQDNE